MATDVRGAPRSHTRRPYLRTFRIATNRKAPRYGQVDPIRSAVLSDGCTEWKAPGGKRPFEFGEDLVIRCDVTNAGQVEAAVCAVMGAFGRIDVLINNAGRGHRASIEEIGLADFRGLLDLNLVAPLITMQAVIPIMRKQGSGKIINVSSGIGFAALPGTGAYSASKSGLAQLSAVARAELQEAGIVVSTLYPSFTEMESVKSIRTGCEAGPDMKPGHAQEPQTPDQAVRAMLHMIGAGAEQADPVSERYC